MNDRVTTLLSGRRERLGQVVGRYLAPPRATGAPPDVRQHLIEEATDLYWDELEWEHITHDAGDEAIERAFPGLLAFVRGLLLREAVPGGEDPCPRPEVVEELLRFLAARVLDLDGQERSTASPRRCGSSWTRPIDFWTLSCTIGSI